MERFEVEGTSLLSWTIRVQAHNEREAVEEAERIARWIDLPSSLVTVNAAQHRIVGWGVADSEGPRRYSGHGTGASCWPSEDPVICRVCPRCGAVHEMPQDELVCHRCGRMKVWTVTVNGQVVAAGRKNSRGGEIWLAGTLDDLRPSPGRGAAGSHGGWNDEN